MDKDALIHRIGQLVIADPKVNAEPWDSYALIADFDGATARIVGYRYTDAGDWEAATPRDPDLAESVRALREATRVDGKAPWLACVLRIVRATGKLHAEFEYDDPGRWRITPAALREVVERARPG